MRSNEENRFIVGAGQIVLSPSSKSKKVVTPVLEKYISDPSDDREEK